MVVITANTYQPNKNQRIKFVCKEKPAQKEVYIKGVPFKKNLFCIIMLKFDIVEASKHSSQICFGEEFQFYLTEKSKND